MKKHVLRRLAVAAFAIASVSTGLIAATAGPAAAYEPGDCHGGTFEVWCDNDTEGLSVWKVG